MSHLRNRSFATSLLLTGLLVTLLSLGGGWGRAYGQTAGPTPTPSQAMLSVTKEADSASTFPGDTVVFIIRVSNNGSTAAQNVTVTDALPGAFELVNAFATLGTVSTSGQTVTVTIPQLDPGMSVVITVEVRVRPDAIGAVVNQVVVRAFNLDGQALSDQMASASVDVQASAADADGAAGDNAGSDGAVGNAGGAAGNADDSGPRSQLSNTGADSTLQWSLLVLGLVLMSAGLLIFVRARKTS